MKSLSAFSTAARPHPHSPFSILHSPAPFQVFEFRASSRPSHSPLCPTCALNNAAPSPAPTLTMVDAPPRPATHPVGSSNTSDRPDPTAGHDPEPSSHSITPSSHSRSRSPRSSSSDTSDSDLDRENYIGLHQIETQRHDDSTPSISSGEYRINTRRTVSRTSQSSRPPREGVLGRIQRFWTRNVVLTVAQKKNRDYFGAFSR